MNLIVSELGLHATTKQLYTIGDKDIRLYAIRPHLYFHLAPAGSLYVEIQDANGKKIGVSETLTISAIQTSLSAVNYTHGFVRFLCTVNLKANTSYYFELKSSGYTYDPAAYAGWVGSPLEVQLWQYEAPIKGVA